MCVVSMITDYHKGWPEDKWTRISWETYQELVRKAREYDRITSQPDCQKPDIDEWEKTIEHLLKRKGII